MPKFRKLPVVVEAEQWTGTTDTLSDEFSDAVEYGPQFPSKPFIYTLEGMMWLDLGDWIIKGVKGEFYPCKPVIFGMTYEAAE
jgi:hypothetical protein